MRVIVTGSKGMLARDMIPVLKENHEVVEFSKELLDITDLSKIEKIIGNEKPDVVINCAAYTAVDRAESESEKAYLLNAKGPEILAKACHKALVRLVHVSTDFVFDGKTPRPYKEDDEVNPIGVYGKSKLEGENAIRSSMENYVIVRTSWLYGQGGESFPEKILSKASAPPEADETISVVFDQVGSPTYAVDLARAVERLLPAPPGMYHFSNEGVASWYDFAYAVIEAFKKRKVEFKLKAIKPVLSGQYPTPAPRPAYSVLDKAKYKRITGMDIPHWLDAVARYAERKTAGSPLFQRGVGGDSL
ncbi:MAG: dTDP-4-dehydrorhamnose reductase [Deltaproteobacteria bacterium]